MKRRNAEIGKMRRPIKRTKITEGMYGNSLLYLKFVMVWATVVMADYMLEFRFEFLWPFWMMLRSVYDSFKYQGLAFSVFFICIALTSDMICFFFIPVQWIFFAASAYVWVQYVWYTVADKGLCLPTVALCCVLVYVEGAVRGDRNGDLDSGGLEFCRPLAAHCVGYPVVTLGFGVKSFVGHKMRLRRQKQVQVQNDFYFQLMREALPESALEQTQTSTKDEKPTTPVANGGVDRPSEADHKHMNGTAHSKDRSRKGERARPEPNGACHHEHSTIQINNKVEKQISHSVSKDKETKETKPPSATPAAAASSGAADPAHDDEDKRDTSRGSGKSAKCERREKEKEASTLKEEKRKNRNRDKDRDNSDSHRSTEQSKDNILKEKEVESTKENVKSNKENNSNKERERERERELRAARECAEELARARAELGAAQRDEAEARRALAAAASAERQRRQDHQQLRQAHQALQHKLSTCRAALERRLGEERRARSAAEHQLQRAQAQALLLAKQRKTGECESESCRARRAAAEAEAGALRREAARARERAAQLQRDLAHATEQVRSLEVRSPIESAPGPGPGAVGCVPGEGARLASAWAALQERHAHLERSLSAETRVKLDLLSALGDAKRQLALREGTISQQVKEIDELRTQIMAMMQRGGGGGGAGGAARLADGSPLDPNASVYTPKQLCSDA